MRPALFLLLSACSDSGLKVHNDAPAVSFTSPADGSEVGEGEPLSLIAQVSDRESDNEALSYFWQDSTGAPLSGETTITPDSVLFVLPLGLPAGQHEIQLTVVDPDAASGQDQLALTVAAGAAPAPRFAAPLATDTQLRGEPVSVELETGRPQRGRARPPPPPPTAGPASTSPISRWASPAST
jgi:hypothetical protein